jgi:hypothetical protein
MTALIDWGNAHIVIHMWLEISSGGLAFGPDKWSMENWRPYRDASRADSGKQPHDAPEVRSVSQYFCITMWLYAPRI